MFTATKIGALTLSILAASEDVLARPLLAFRQSTNSSIGDFGSCTVPQIQFATGFDNRKETSFEPVDLTSYPHGSAQGIDIITQFMCDQLVNSCGADATAKATCASAAAAADTATAKTGAQADKFNAVFGIQTNFAAVPVVSDQGVTLGVDGSGTSAAASATSAVAVASAASATTTSIAATVADTATSSDPCPVKFQNSNLTSVIAVFKIVGACSHDVKFLHESIPSSETRLWTQMFTEFFDFWCDTK